MKNAVRLRLVRVDKSAANQRRVVKDDLVRVARRLREQVEARRRQVGCGGECRNCRGFRERCDERESAGNGLGLFDDGGGVNVSEIDFVRSPRTCGMFVTSKFRFGFFC